MEDDDFIFENYVPTTVPTGQLLPLFIAGTTTCLLFLPVIWSALRPSSQIDEDEHDQENGNVSSPSKINGSLQEKTKVEESEPLLPAPSADVSEYSGLSLSSKVRRSQISHSFDSSAKRANHSFDTIKSFEDDEVGRCNANKFSDPSTSTMERLKILTLHNCDAQTKSMLDIGLPYLIQTLVSAVSEFIQMGVVGYQLGTDALTAYVVVDLFVRMTTEAVGNVITSGHNLIAQVVDSKDKNRERKVGNYLMLSIVFYVIGMIPLVLFWSLYTEKFLLWLNLDPKIAAEGQGFARAYVITLLISGAQSAFQHTLDVVGYQIQTMIMTIIGMTFVTLGIVVVMCHHTLFPKPSLTKMGWAYVIIESCYITGMLTTIYVMGWLRPYYAGLFTSPRAILQKSTNELGTSRAAVTLMISNAIQYALSNFIFEGEWQILLLFAR